MARNAQAWSPWTWLGKNVYLERPSVHIWVSKKHHGAVGFGNSLCQLAPAMPGASFIQVLVKLQTLKSVHIMNPDISGYKG